MSRYSAFAIHLGISLAIFAAIAWVILAVWYPSFFFETDGGWQGIRLMFLVDVVLGPALTLIVFKVGKPGLKFDLAAIACAQVIALAGGLWVVHDERPLALVYLDGQFFSLSRNDFADAKVAIPNLDAFPGRYPKQVEVQLPDDPIVQSDVRSSALKSGVPLRLATDRWVPLASDATLVANDYDATELHQRDAATHEVSRWATAHGGAIDDFRFFPFGARYKYVYLAYRAATNECVGLLDVDVPHSNQPG
jgi:hypothetical protein